jgi:hypothetical protein
MTPIQRKLPSLITPQPEFPSLKMMAKVKVPSISSIMNLENPNKKV